jgi:hypothetical protein
MAIILQVSLAGCADARMEKEIMSPLDFSDIRKGDATRARTILRYPVKGA